MRNIYSLAEKNLYDLLKKALKKLLKLEKIEINEIDFLVEETQKEEFGDFATNIAMVSAKHFRENPFSLAEKITKNLSLSDSFFSKFEIKKPGFINFFLNDKWYAKVVKNILELKEDYGKTNFGEGKSAILEFVSANPTGPMHIGNARGGAIGDALAECFRFASFNVLTEFYVNDAGNQIEKFKNSLYFRYMQIFSDDDKFEMPDDCYLGEDIVEHAKNFAKLHGDAYVNVDEKEAKKALLNYALPINIDNLKKDLLKYKVKYDNWFFESSLYKDNRVIKIIELLKEKGFTYEKDGAVWLNLKKIGKEKDEVLLRDNKIPTYFASDIAYHFDKFEKRKFLFAVNVWGADHHGHVERLKNALKILGVNPERLTVVIMQMVRLVKKGETLKLSKRKGNAVSLNTLLEIIPIDVARFFFNMKDPNTHFDFDLDLAEQKSDQNPVYYVQYAYARIYGILNNLNALEYDYLKDEDLDFNLLQTREEKGLIKQIAKFPSEIILAVQNYNPSKIAKFAVDTATKFHKFYVVCKIKGEDEKTKKARLALCEAVKITLKNAFDILKTKAKEKL